LLEYPWYRNDCTEKKVDLMPNRPEFGTDQTKRPAIRDSWSVLPTVRDVLALPVLVDALPEVLAGREALDSPVRWVHVSESLGVAKLLNGGELLLTTGAGWSSDEAELRRYIAELVQVGAVGLVLELVQRFDAAPPAVLDACQHHGFPLIVLHREVKFVAVTEAVHSRIISEQTSALRARDELRELFTQLSLRGSPADFIVRQLSQILHAPVVLENLGHEVIAVEGEGAVATDVLDGWEQKSRAAHRATEQRVRTGEAIKVDQWLVVPVEARGTRWGALIALPGEPHPAGRVAVLEQGAIALALGRLADRDGNEWLRISHQHLLDTLFGGRYASSVGATARLQSAGFPIVDRMLVGLVVMSRSAELPLSAITALGSAAAAVGGRAIGGATPGTSGQLAACLSLPSGTGFDDGQVKRFARSFATSVGVAVEGLLVGVGSVASDLAGMLASLQEAMELLGSMFNPGRGLVIQRAEDRPLLRLITALREDPRVQDHAQRMLGPLIEYDLGHNGDLLAVLAATLAHPTNRTAAAAASHLSRSVFYQRLALIADLLDVDLDDGETLASLYMALLAR
jgi:purine catabolism regulator